MDRKKEIEQIACDLGGDRTRLIDMLWRVQERAGFISHFDTDTLARALALSPADVREVTSFYHFFHDRPRGRYQIYLDSSIIAEFSGMPTVREEFEREIGIKVGEVSPDGLFGLFETSCIGMSDQSPAALINMTPFTRLDRSRVKQIIGGLRGGKTLAEVVSEMGRGDGMNGADSVGSMVRNNIRKAGPFLFAPYIRGEALAKAEAMGAEGVIRHITASGLRGRGGAGFPTGRKWEACRGYSAEKHYVVCNADEGEPGTFKDRVLLTEYPDLVIEGMAVAALAIGAKEAIIYLRAEYRYLQAHIEKHIAEFMAGPHNVGGIKLRVQLGAGAYICGEESALLESLEGKRGEPRLKPPFPVEKGFLGFPTVVNNVETFALAAQIIRQGADNFKALGTEKSPGVRLLSISGDVEKPGIYEVPWGITIGETMKMAGAIEPEIVQVGGPSGVMIRATDAERRISYEDLATGGSFMVFSRHRSLFQIFDNFMTFFVNESCGNCAPCRAGNVVLRDLLRRFAEGHARHEDLGKIDQWARIVTKNSRCGLGMTSPNVLTTGKKAFPEVFENAIRPSASDLFYDFDMAEATAEYDKAIRELK
jgi:[NiFe] hydrogenase diaphorase moiety large subunit